MKFLRFIWVGHENFRIYLGGSWNFLPLFGWVTKFFKLSNSFIFFFLNKIFKTQTFPISKATFTWASCTSQNCMEAQQLKFTSFVSLCLQQLCSHDVFTRASNRAALHSRPALQGAKGAEALEAQKSQSIIHVCCSSIMLTQHDLLLIH